MVAAPELPSPLEGEGLGVRAGPAALKSKWYQGDLEP